jgi:hypothetical protein
LSEYLSENLFDTSDSREKIFAKIRAMQKRPESDRPAEFEQASAYMQLHKRGPQPKAPNHLMELFHLQSNKLFTTLSYVSEINDSPAAVAKYLAGNALLGHQASVWPAISHLPWTAAGLDVVYGAPTGDHLIGVGAVLCAVAEPAPWCWPAAKKLRPAHIYYRKPILPCYMLIKLCTRWKTRLIVYVNYWVKCRVL